MGRREEQELVLQTQLSFSEVLTLEYSSFVFYPLTNTHLKYLFLCNWLQCYCIFLSQTEEEFKGNLQNIAVF